MTIPSGAGDGLVRPLNAPSVHGVLSGVQPGTSGNVVLAQYVIIFGNPSSSTGAAPGVFIYSGSPAPGNPPIFSMSNATEDPYGNAIAPGIWAGPFGSIQAGLEYSGTVGQALFPVGGSAVAALAGGIAGVASGTGSVVQIFSPEDASPLNDRVLIDVVDNVAGGGSARCLALYIDPAGVTHTLWSFDAGGLVLNAVNSFTALLPGTGTGPGTPAQSETWHTAALINGWAGSGSGVNGLRYRIVPGGELEIEADIINAGFVPPGNSVCFNLPAGWIPGTSRNRPAGWNNPQVNNSATVPWVNVTAGAIQVTGIEVANKEIFFHVWIPM